MPCRLATSLLFAAAVYCGLLRLVYQPSTGYETRRTLKLRQQSVTNPCKKHRHTTQKYTIPTTLCLICQQTGMELHTILPGTKNVITVTSRRCERVNDMRSSHSHPCCRSRPPSDQREENDTFKTLVTVCNCVQHTCRHWVKRNTVYVNLYPPFPSTVWKDPTEVVTFFITKDMVPIYTAEKPARKLPCQFNFNGNVFHACRLLIIITSASVDTMDPPQEGGSCLRNIISLESASTQFAESYFSSTLLHCVST
jgi:hypothetical protein